MKVSRVQSPLIKIIVAGIIGTFGITSLAAASPDWVESYGMNTPYSRETHLTGFAAVSKDEANARETARDRAAADLSGKIRIKVQSELVAIESETDGKSSSSVSQVTKNSVNVSVSGIEYDFHEDRRNLYALAHIPTETLLKNYTGEAAGYWEEIREALRKARGFSSSGRGDKALETLYGIKAAFPNLYERWTLARSVAGNDAAFFQGLPEARTLADLQRAESDVGAMIDELEDRSASSIDEAVGMIAVMLHRQNVTGGHTRVPPALYESTTFSSEFGRYVAERLESKLVEALPSGREPSVFRSQYWEEGGRIRLIVLVSDENGEKKGRAEVLLPTTAAGRRSLKPQGFDEAMVALQEFAEGAISDGGLNVDVWTNKGRDEDALVFTDGEIVQLYFRVNQPATLQVTYRLATGELVLLEQAFYIGSDRVNRTVPLPYEFEVQAPYGVENLIVTAYSASPPPVNILPKEISGELYDVFGSMKEVVANTRGLGRRQNEGEQTQRIGEAMLTLTTLQN